MGALRERLAALAAQRADRERQVRLVEGLDAFCASVRAGLEDPTSRSSSGSSNWSWTASSSRATASWYTMLCPPGPFDCKRDSNAPKR